jgi:hypothetical protein
MRARIMGVIWVCLAVILISGSALAREVNDFTISDGSATYSFKLTETALKLFHVSYQQGGGVADQREKVFTYEAVGPAPFDNEVMRLEIAEKVRLLYYTPESALEGGPAIEMPFGISCFDLAPNALGIGMSTSVRFKVINGVIKSVEASSGGTGCKTFKNIVEHYESENPKLKKAK